MCALEECLRLPSRCQESCPGEQTLHLHIHQWLSAFILTNSGKASYFLSSHQSVFSGYYNVGIGSEKEIFTDLFPKSHSLRITLSTYNYKE